MGYRFQSAFLEEDRPFLERVYDVFYVDKFFREWKAWLLHKQNPYPASLKRGSMPSAQFLDTIRLAANGLVLGGIIMAEHYPEWPFIVRSCSTSKLENLFATVRSLSGDCKSSNTYGEFLWKLRKSIQKTISLKEINEARGIPQSDSQFNDNFFPGKIENLRDEIKKTINQSQSDCAQSVSSHLTIQEPDEEKEVYQDESMMEQIFFIVSQRENPSRDKSAESFEKDSDDENESDEENHVDEVRYMVNQANCCILFSD